MADKSEKTKARLPRGFVDRPAEDIRAVEKMTAKIRFMITPAEMMARSGTRVTSPVALMSSRVPLMTGTGAVCAIALAGNAAAPRAIAVNRVLRIIFSHQGTGPSSACWRKRDGPNVNGREPISDGGEPAYR